MMAEYWRPIPGFDGWYEISNHAEIRSWKIIGGGKDSKGRRSPEPRPLSLRVRYQKDRRKPTLAITLMNGEGKRMSISVKKSMRDIWMQGVKPGCEVQFVDGDTLNCALHNLRYVPIREGRSSREAPQRKPVAKYNSRHEVVEYYRSVGECDRKNYLAKGGTRHRIRSHTVVDGCYFKYAE